MKKLNLIKMLIFIISGGLSYANANSGGWVGNSPIASYTAQIAMMPYYSSDEGKEWNSILMPEGQSRFKTRLSFCDTCEYSKGSWDIGYDYGFTPKLTTFGFGTWGYSLKSGNGLGSEWAVLFGLVHGVLESETFGLSVGPGVGLAYAYSENDWRVDVTSTVGGYYNFDLHYWRSVESRTEISYTKWLSDNWGVGGSSAYLYRKGYSKEKICGVDCSATQEMYSFSGFYDPRIYAIYNLNKAHQFNGGYRRSINSDRSITDIGYSYTW